MSWRDNLIDATFRGVPFKVLSSNVKAGRRIKKTERFQKRTITRDMGPLLPTFVLDAYIVQNAENNFDYFEERDQLIKALGYWGVGTLDHPFHGRLRVHVESYDLDESFREGGIARFKIIFLLEDEEIFPVEGRDYAQASDTAATAVRNEVIDNFADVFDTTRSFIDSIGNDAAFFMGKMQTAVARINNTIKSTVATAIGIMTTAITTIDSVLDSPCDFSETILDAIDAFKEVVGMAGEVIDNGIVGRCSGEERTEGTILDGETIPEKLGKSTVTQLLFAQGFDEDDLPQTTAGQLNNRMVLINLIKLLLITLSTQVALRIEFGSQEKMFETLYEITASIEALLLRLGGQVYIDNVNVYNKLEELRNIFVSLMIEKGAELKRTVDYQVPSYIQSTLELAYNKYEDTDRSDEIYKRNENIIHPGFMPNGEIIKILEE